MSRELQICCVRQLALEASLISWCVTLLYITGFSLQQLS